MRITTLLLRMAFGAALSLGAGAQVQAQAGATLEALAAKPMLVLPAQYASFADTAGWVKQLPPTRTLLAMLDSALASALLERGLSSWKFADDVIRSSKRNAGFAADPRALAAFALRIGKRPPKDPFGDPLASQLRSLIALGDARHVILPSELRFVRQEGKERAILRLVVIDARRSQVEWVGDIETTPATTWSSAVMAELVGKVANLVVPGS
jgi:hypothetical protein